MAPGSVVSHGAIGNVLANKGDVAGALEQYRQAVELRRTAVAADPNDDFAKSALARGYERVASLLGRLGDIGAAVEAQRERIAVYEARRSAHPERDAVWADETTAALDAALKLLDLLESHPDAIRPGHGPPCGRC